MHRPLFVPGKRQERLAVAATAGRPTSSGGTRVFVTDRATNTKFLADSGSDVCCYPRRLLRGLMRPTTYELDAANDATIHTYGPKLMNLDLGLRRDFPWTFIIADVSVPILGSDFLAHYDLLPDCRRARLLDLTTGLTAQGERTLTKQPSVRAVAPHSSSNRFSSVLAEYAAITKPPGLPREVKHNTKHYIETTAGPPVTCRPRRLEPGRYQIAKSEFTEMVRVGTARPSKSPWSSPLHLAKKKDPSWRPCGDYRQLNKRTIKDCYPVRHMQDCRNNLNGCTVFSTIDLVKAYQQIPVAEEDICKTAISTPFGLFEFMFMTFGLKNAGQTFQRFIDEVTRGLDFVFPYIYDLLVFSHSDEEHDNHLRELFQRLADYGVVVNPAKTLLGAPEVRFLGHTVATAGTRPPADRIMALQEYPLPKQ